MTKKKKPSSDAQGIGRIITDATLGVTDIVEAMHKRVVHPPFLPSTPIQHLITHIASITYKNIRWSTRVIGKGADKALGIYSSLSGTNNTTDQKEAMRSVLNGVVGDYLEKNNNPLQINMEFRYEAKAISIDSESLQKTYPKINGKILLMIHGSCMNDIQWTRDDHNHGTLLAQELNKTAIYLHYNSGLHISTNGQSLNELLEELMLHWPVPIEELIIVAHSMGGLVARSALFYAEQHKKQWHKHLKKIIFLGTPHHGSSLEQAGNYLDAVLEAVPYAKPFARLGKIRSAGVTDLRFGNIVDEDWKYYDRFEVQGDKRKNVPLPKKVASYSIAAVIGKSITSGSSKLVGDKMVGVKSALGQHSNPAKNLNFKKENTWVAFECNHVDLLDKQEVYAKIKQWLV
jgi:pimeloyl-ACP methyl ester carboxylesterase